MSSLVAGTGSVDELTAAWFRDGQRRFGLLVGVSALAASLLAALLVLRLEIIAAVAVYVAIGLFGVAWRPRIGIYVLFGLMLLFESVSADPLMLPGRFLPIGLQGSVINPLEALLFLILGIWLAQGIASRGLKYRAGRLGWPVLLFLLALVAGLIRGQVSGGDFRIGLWESRFLFYIVACYLLAANTVRTVGNVRVFTTLLLVCNGLFAIEGAFRWATMINTGQISGDLAFEHEDVIFLGIAILLVLVQNVFGAPRWQQLLGYLVAPMCTFTLLASQRRAGYVAVIVAFLLIGCILLFTRRKAFFLIFVPMILVGSVYLPVFWNNTSLLGQPARAIRSLSQPDERDAASNLYRDLEKIDVQAGIASNPVLGVGFGQPFPFVVQLPDLSWWAFWHYEPHHNILWVWLKTGAIGFTLFFVLMGSGIAHAAHLVAVLRHQELRGFALIVLAAIVMTLVFSYVDLGLVSGRVTICLGTLLGCLGVLDRISPVPTTCVGNSTSVRA